MIKAQEIVKLIEDVEVAETENTPDLKQQQAELLAFIKDSLERVQMGKQSLDAFHMREGVKCMLTDEAKRLYNDIQQMVKCMFLNQQGD